MFLKKILLLKNMKYRILERLDEKTYRYIPFGVAYQIREGFILNVPGWRSPAPLKVSGLEALTERHFPSKSKEYRWSEIKHQKRKTDVYHILTKAF